MKICLFHDLLSDISPNEKEGMLREMGAKVVASPATGDSKEDREAQRFGFTSNMRRQYRDVVMGMRRRFGRFAPNAMAALGRAHGDVQWMRSFSGAEREFFSLLNEMPDEKMEGLPAWAMNPGNWYQLDSGVGAFELQSSVSSMFPCTVFDDLPLECANPQSDVALENLDDILSATGVYQAWESGNLGNAGKVVVLDTGVSRDLKSAFSIPESTVGGLAGGDEDGHGSAVANLILALAPKAELESVKVMRSYSESSIWNLVAGLTGLYKRAGHLINISLGVNPRFLTTLGPGAISFQESITQLVASAASQRCFVISASGNDGSTYLRWPSAAPDALAVGGYSASGRLSTFANHSTNASNFILTPGGEARSEEHRLESFGKYGSGLSRDILGTSFSCAIATGVSAILQGYGWFQTMDIASRISLYRNHCRKNRDGYPILNIADIGAVWPLRSSGPAVPIEFLLRQLQRSGS